MRHNRIIWGVLVLCVAAVIAFFVAALRSSL